MQAQLENVHLISEECEWGVRGGHRNEKLYLRDKRQCSSEHRCQANTDPRVLPPFLVVEIWCSSTTREVEESEELKVVEMEMSEVEIKRSETKSMDLIEKVKEEE